MLPENQTHQQERINQFHRYKEREASVKSLNLLTQRVFFLANKIPIFQ